MINLEEFQKIELKTAKVIEAEKVEDSEKLLAKKRVSHLFTHSRYQAIWCKFTKPLLGGLMKV